MENKWWEYYAVRYFVGTVVGAVLVAFVSGHDGSPFAGQLKFGNDAPNQTFLGLSLFAALGFAYCYVASAPILTLHSARAHLRLAGVKARWFSYAWPFIVSILLCIGTGWLLMPLVAAALTGIIVGFQLALIGLALWSRASVIEAFYRQLAVARATAVDGGGVTPAAEYITSYRHMREHGNAFMIVLLEGVLAYVLISLPSVAHAFALLAVWLLPAVIAWVLGTILERRFASNPCLLKACGSQTSSNDAK